MKPDRKKLEKELLDLWSKAARLRDGKCKNCGNDQRLSAHHIRVKRHSITKYSLENALTLCWPCHSLQKLNPERFHDMIIEIIGQKEYDRLKKISNMTYKWSLEELERIKEQLLSEIGKYQ
jgi:5-methylcytosine-specific restriction endonuclease McrA